MGFRVVEQIEAELQSGLCMMGVYNLCLADEASASRGQESICLSLVLVRHKNGCLGNLVGGDILARSNYVFLYQGQTLLKMFW